jgi:integrase
MSRSRNPLLRKWTDPEISPKNPRPGDLNKTWSVVFRFFDERAGVWKQIARKSDLNSFTSYTQRLAEAKALKQSIRFKLEECGWDPLTGIDTPPAQPKNAFDLELERIKELTFKEAIQFAYKKKLADWSKKSGQDYKSAVKYLLQGAAKIELLNKRMGDFQLPHYRAVLDATAGNRKMSGAGYNKYRDYLSALVSEMIQWQIVQLNLVYHIPLKKFVKKMAHRPPTTDERKVIVQRIRTDHPDFYRFIAVVYGCTIRPKEITRLKIRHLHKLDQIFRITPDLKEENSKTLTERDVIIPDWVMTVLSELNLHRLDPDWYIFSSSASGASFRPGPRRMHSNTTHNTWRRIVKAPMQEGGLGMNIDLYGLKKLAGNDMVRIQRQEGVDKLLELPAAQMGHTTTKMTEVYVDEHLQVMKDIVRKKMPIL